MESLKLSLKVEEVIMWALIETLLCLTAITIRQRGLKSANPRRMAANGGSSPAAETRRRRVEARDSEDPTDLLSDGDGGAFPANPRSPTLSSVVCAYCSCSCSAVYVLYSAVFMCIGQLTLSGSIWKFLDGLGYLYAWIIQPLLEYFYQNQIFRNVQSQAYTCVATETVSLTFVAKRGNFLQALKTSRDQHMWIVDSGASDHMTDSHKLFTTYIPCAGNVKVKIADGSLASIAGKGSIKISKNITLESILHVPKLACSLLSIIDEAIRLLC